MSGQGPTEVSQITGKRQYYRDQYTDRRAYGLISAAKSKLMLEHPFWGFMGLDLVLVEIPHGLAHGTLCTDGYHIFYSAKFINLLRQGEVEFAVAHEVYHCLWGHTGGDGKVNRMRGDNWDPELANKAQDYFINLDLKESGVGEFITTIQILYDPKYAGMSSEEIYMDLVENGDPMPETDTMDMHIEFEIVDDEEDQDAGSGGDEDGDGDGDQQDGDGKGQGDDGEDGDGDGDGSDGEGQGDGSGKGKGKSQGQSQGDGEGEGDGQGDGNGNGPLNQGEAGQGNTIKIRISKSQAEVVRNNWEEVAQRAVAHVENSTPGSAGSIPAHLRRLISEIKKPKIDWRAVLRKFTVMLRSTGYSFTRPDKRTFGGGMTLPGFRRDDKKLEVAVAFDTSGSVGEDALNKFIGEFFGIMKGFKAYEIHAFCFEGSVDEASYKHIKSTHKDAETDLREYVEDHFFGGGGTMFGSVWDFLRKKRIKPRGLVFFTDGYPCDHEWETRDRMYCPTLFVTVGNMDNWEAPFGKTVQYEDMAA